MKFDVLISWYFASASAIDSYKGKIQIALFVCVFVYKNLTNNMKDRTKIL